MALQLHFFADIPMQPITSALGFGLVLVLVAVGTGVCSPNSFALDMQKYWEGEWWRPIISIFFLGKFSLRALISLGSAYNASLWLENNRYFNNPAQYAWILFTMACMILALAPRINLKYPAEALLEAIYYLASRYRDDQLMLVLFVIPIRSSYWRLLAIVIDSAINPDEAPSLVLGFVAGHVIYYFDEVHPLWSGKRLLQPPWQWWRRRQQLD